MLWFLSISIRTLFITRPIFGFPPGFAESIMFERNLFQSKFAEFFEITYGEAAWLAVHTQCMASETDSMTPDEINAK